MINVERSQVRKETAWAIMYTQPGSLTGHVMLLLMFFIYTTAHVKIRTQCFEAFWYTHHLVSGLAGSIAYINGLTVEYRPSSSFSVSIRTPVSRLGARRRRSLIAHHVSTAGCFVRGALPDAPVTCLGYESWHWTIWGGIAYFIERVVREVRRGRSFHSSAHCANVLH